MAQYFGEVQGAHGKATRLGTVKSGMRSEARGWDLGGYAIMDWDHDTESDTAIIGVSSGSDGRALCGFTARQIGEDKRIVISHIEHELLEMITDEAWTTAIRNSGVLAERLRKLVFVNLDKVQP